ncbi:valine--tRNA ligase [Hyphobacterium sp.]|uniref:valine--tRNA ligase n=1 Tax=Hyphobacterium sp. TaxID=2004662 RepID=UPI003BAD3EB9
MTDLAKTFDPKNTEPRLYAAWEEAGTFKPKDDPDAETYSIVIPPPNVTGSLHIGHALNNTLQDVLIRYHRMLGKSVLWQPGTDHAGIATQMVVERQLAEQGNISRRDMGREEFIERVWEWKEESGGTILNQLRRLGASCDWSRERFTMDEGLSKAVLKVFVELYNQDLIYRGKRLVNWDPHFETAISDLEVENTEVDGHMWHFKYPLADGRTYTYVEKDADGNIVLEEKRDYISIATTRPETMLGDGAVAVHPDDERYAPIVGALCEIPVGPKEHRRLIPIITDEYPDPEFGSGAVKITGAHDFNDYEVAKRNNIPLYRLMDLRASLRADGAPYAEDSAKAMEIAKTGNLPSENEVDAINLVPEEYRGLDRFEAREKIVKAITEEGLAVTVKTEEGSEKPFVENKKIQQPFGDRSGVVIEPMLTDQWFVKADILAKEAIESVEDGRTKFHPKNWENTYFNWMRNIQPWCISRQLWWGHRIPAWYDEDGKVFVAESEAEASAAAGGKPLRQDEDVLDTWFSSALWPFSTLGWPDDTKELERFYPTSVLVTAFDIIFFWVARMMMQGLHFKQEIPFHDVYIHALVRDEHGAKMSKSKGNVIDPLELVDEYGADAVRFTLAALAAQGRDIRMSKERVEGYRNFGTKLWNAARFCLMNDCVQDPDFDPKSVKQTVNQWLLGEAEVASAAVAKGLETYRFNEAAGAAYRFVWNVFCDWHLEFAKPLLSGEDEAAKAETRATTAYVLEIALKLLHPFMPFVTEELWEKTAGERGRDSLLIVADWPKLDGLANPEAQAEMNWLVGLITEIRKLRSEMNIPPNAKPNGLAVGADADLAARLERQSALICRLARLDSVAPAESAPDGSAQIVVDEVTYALPLEGVIDFDAERARLDKEIDKVTGEITRLEKKLGNEKFVANAPEAVVAGEREKLADYTAQKEALAEARARLG